MASTAPTTSPKLAPAGSGLTLVQPAPGSQFAGPSASPVAGVETPAGLSGTFRALGKPLDGRLFVERGDVRLGAGVFGVLAGDEQVVFAPLSPGAISPIGCDVYGACQMGAATLRAATGIRPANRDDGAYLFRDLAIVPGPIPRKVDAWGQVGVQPKPDLAGQAKEEAAYYAAVPPAPCKTYASGSWSLRSGQGGTRVVFPDGSEDRFLGIVGAKISEWSSPDAEGAYAAVPPEFGGKFRSGESYDLLGLNLSQAYGDVATPAGLEAWRAATNPRLDDLGCNLLRGNCHGALYPSRPRMASVGGKDVYKGAPGAIQLRDAAGNLTDTWVPNPDAPGLFDWLVKALDMGADKRDPMCCGRTFGNELDLGLLPAAGRREYVAKWHRLYAAAYAIANPGKLLLSHQVLMGTPLDVLQGIADAGVPLVVNYYGPPDGPMLDDLDSLGTPWMIGETLYALGLYADRPAFQPGLYCRSEEDRARRTLRLVARCGRSPFCFGLAWFGLWHQPPLLGRQGDGESVYGGLYDLQNRPYPLTIGALRAFRR